MSSEISQPNHQTKPPRKVRSKPPISNKTVLVRAVEPPTPAALAAIAVLQEWREESLTPEEVARMQADWESLQGALEKNRLSNKMKR